jgi:hypothetical protein
MVFFFILAQIIKSWWWFFLPIFLSLGAKTFYFWWIRWEVWYKKKKWILLEIRPPRENIKPFSTMENVFSMLWGIYDSPNWRERWCGGVLPLGGGLWFSFEIVSFGGEIHFYMRIPEDFRKTAEDILYSQYPDLEITLAEDYTKKVPKDIPNEKWDLYAEDYSLLRPDHFPIKTYSMFFEREQEERRIIEEKRLDPLDTLLEGLSKLNKGEQLWFQIVCNPITEDTFPWLKKAREAADKIAKRPTSPPKKPIIFEFFRFFFLIPIEAVRFLMYGSAGLETTKKEEAKPAELVAPELRLTPGEKEILTAIETKMKKNAFQCWIRQVFLYRLDQPHSPGNYKIIRTYLMGQFSAANLNTFVYWGPTRTKIHYFLKKRRLYLRKRQRLRNYIERLPSLWPRTQTGEPICPFGHVQGRKPGIRGTIILSTEELATIFHFPIKVLTPALKAVEAKKIGPPPGLPTRE